MTEERAYRIYKLATGTVIDHIPAGRGVAVVKLLGLDKPGSHIVALGVNLESKKFGRKDVLKIEDKLLSSEELSKVALVAPTATISILRDHCTVRKEAVHIPVDVRGLLVCPNLNCVTNHQQVQTRFNHANKCFTCFYCEREYGVDEIRLRR